MHLRRQFPPLVSSPRPIRAVGLLVERFAINDAAVLYELHEQRLPLLRLRRIRHDQRVVSSVDAQVSAERLLAWRVGELHVGMVAGGAALERGSQRVAMDQLPP